jgi:NAD(P)-dependent dehydrogenase (short-subunit alcohol dehydrogenase family)
VHADLAKRFDLTGRTAIVTGGSRGLGRAMALGFASAGANVVIASRKLDACQLVVDQITEAGGNALAASVQMSDPSSLAGLVEASMQRFGGISILVNNGLDALDQDSFVGAFTTNLLSPLLLIQAARPHLAASGHGSIINIVSIAMDRSAPNRYLYPPVKAGLAQTTRTLAVELATDNIRVNAISPGTFRTDMVTKAMNDKVLERVASVTPLRRIGDPDELVGPALLLASDAGSFITGVVLTVDGGATA